MKKLLVTFYNIIFFNCIFTCTIGLMYDNQNRPVIWKNRDRPITFEPSEINDLFNRTNELYFQDNTNHYDYLAISTAADFEYNYPFMGVNEVGFGIINSYVGINEEISDQFRTDDHDIFNNVDVIRNAFMHCERVEDFIDIVENIDLIPINEDKKISSNFIAIDRFGNSVVLELYVDSFIKQSYYEVFDSSTNFIIRTNKFEFDSMLELNPDTSQIETSYYRYNKSANILNQISDNFSATDLFSLDEYIENSHLPLLRNYSRSNLNDYQIPYPKQTAENDPYGYFFTDKSINRARTVSSMVIQGVSDSSDYLNSKVWANVGNPITSPYFSYSLSEVCNNPNIISDLNGYTFSFLTNQLRELLIDYSQGSDFKSYIDSYLIEEILGELYFIESNNISAEDAYFHLFNFSPTYDYNCGIGIQMLNGRDIIIDQSKHYPEACYWNFYDKSGNLISSSQTCYNPEISYPLDESYYNMTIDHSIVNNGMIYECDPINFLAGDLNQDSISNILDLVELCNIVVNSESYDLNSWERFTVNLNNDENINVSDLIIIVNFILDN